MIAFLKSVKLWAYAALAALGVGLLAWLRMDAKRDVRSEMELDDYENADDIRRRADRADERLREFDDAGWRD